MIASRNSSSDVAADAATPSSRSYEIRSYADLFLKRGPSGDGASPVAGPSFLPSLVRFAKTEGKRAQWLPRGGRGLDTECCGAGRVKSTSPT